MLRLLTCCSLLALGAPSQAPSAWTPLHVPTGVVAAQATSQGKLIAYRDGGTLHVYSAVTRRWTSTTVSTQPTILLHNDCLLVQGGGTWLAFSAYRGRFEPLAVSANATLQNAAGAVNDSLLLVADGGQLHAFSAFVGAWSSRAVAPNFQIAVQRHVAILAQGTALSGLAAATGQWHDHVAAVAPTTLSADGTAAFAFGAGTIHAFSATHTTWSDDRELPGASFVRADDWGLWHANHRLLGYSAIRGRFAATSHTVSAVVATQDLFTMVDGPAGIVAFSAITGAFSPPLASAGATVNGSTAVALLGDAAGTWGYSAVHNRATLRPNAGANSGVANVVAWISNGSGGSPWFFSALTSQWYAGPASMLAGDPMLTTTSAAALTSTGCVAFAPRTGHFVPLADPTVTLAGNPSSAPLIAIGSASLHAFDARAARWITTPRAASGVLTSQIWRTGALLLDGATAFGFGVQAGSWSATPLPGPVTSWRANSESVRVSTTNDVFAWSALGAVACWPQFPEFRRVQPDGLPLALVAAVPQNGIALLGLGQLAATATPLPGLGEWLLLPTNVAAWPVLARPTGEPVVVTVPLPPNPSRLGSEFALQAAIWPAAGAPYLTDAATFLPL